MWRILKRQGMPPFYLELLEKMYGGAEMKVRLDKDQDTYTKAFSQERGIRQGSALSPLLFVLCLGFALDVFEEVAGS